MNADFIPPLEAFRRILRAIYPTNPRLPARIKTVEYFRQAQRRYKFSPPGQYQRPEWTQPVPDHAWKPVQALHALRVGIWQQRIELQGERPGEARRIIDGIDSARGDLNPFSEAMTVDKPPLHGFPVTDTYQRVWCSRAGVDAWIAELVPDKAEPVPPSAAIIEVPNSVPAPADISAAYRKVITSHRHWSRSQIQKHAKATIPGFMKKGFDQAWKDYASAEQKAPGIRKRVDA